MAILKFKKTSKQELEANFSAYEFSCKGKGCCDTILVDEKLVNYLQKIRDRFAAPVKITSGFRCEKHNAAVGGTDGSYHKKGRAADITVSGVKPLEVARYAESIGVKGIGLYDSFVHIDTRTTKYFWKNASANNVGTFLASNSVTEWQRAAVADGFKLSVDGVFGKKSEEVAKKAICKKYAVGYKRRNLTKIVQAYVGVTPDGKFGKATKQAVISWQKKNGLAADGIVGLSTWKKMLGVK